MDVKTKKKYTGNYTEKIYICKFCRNEFIHRENLEIHLQNHIEPEPICSFIKFFTNCA